MPKNTYYSKRVEKPQHPESEWLDDSAADAVVVESETMPVVPVAIGGDTSKGAISIEVRVDVAVAVPPHTHIARHVSLSLDRRHAVALRRLFDALHTRHATLASGRHVDRPADAIRYLLERCEEQADQAMSSTAAG